MATKKTAPKKQKTDGPKTVEEYRLLLLQLVGSLTLNDTVGDTMDDIKHVLDRIGYKVASLKCWKCGKPACGYNRFAAFCYEESQYPSGQI